ncbi:hypothetical protein F0562_004379 [Nyssa sinensis]|uniref:DUF3598 domain-containing protein n=1 Tax=Nyssa sinensis TaxID=561372 RepID=A0A5J5C1A2_9ASTE|nr:hypothetical protein F0562_004379 [Nyssa sinensis]
MATLCSISVATMPNPLNQCRIRKLPPNLCSPKSFLRTILSFGSPKTPSTRASSQSATSAITVEEDQKGTEESMSIDALQRFINLNLGNWTGSFHQFDAHGNLMHKVTTKLAVSSYGEDELISLIQTLYIKQSPSSTSISGYDHEPEWAEYKIKETNMFTVDKYQQFADWLFPQ